MFKNVLSAALAAAAFTGLSAAQDMSQEPTYGEATLSPGFLPDPWEVSVTAGGSIDAYDAIGGDCVGDIADAPDYRVNLTDGGGALFFGVISDGDTSLVINAPNGEWFCNDDGGEGLNPFLGGSGALSGQYDVWVGHLSGDASATLYVTEIGE